MDIKTTVRVILEQLNYAEVKKESCLLHLQVLLFFRIQNGATLTAL